MKLKKHTILSYIGLEPPKYPTLWWIWLFTLIQATLMLIILIFNYLVLEHHWALIQDNQMFFAVVIITIIKGWEITTYRDVSVPSGGGFFLHNVLCLLFWILALVWLIRETIYCGGQEGKGSDMTCYDEVSSATSSEAAIIQCSSGGQDTKYTGTCPFMLFSNDGETNGLTIFWMFCQYVTVGAFIVTTTFLLWFTIKLLEWDESLALKLHSDKPKLSPQLPQVYVQPPPSEKRRQTVKTANSVFR
jgi:hypothetical protein